MSLRYNCDGRKLSFPCNRRDFSFSYECSRRGFSFTVGHYPTDGNRRGQGRGGQAKNTAGEVKDSLFFPPQKWFSASFLRHFLVSLPPLFCLTTCCFMNEREKSENEVLKRKFQFKFRSTDCPRVTNEQSRNGNFKTKRWERRIRAPPSNT